MRTRTLLIALAVAVVLQASVVPFLGSGAFRPDLVVLVLIFFAARRGAYLGIITGFATGLIIDSLTAGFLGLSSFCYSTVAFLVGKAFYSDVPLPLDRWALASALGVIVNSLLFAYFYTLGDAPPFTVILMKQVLPMVLYTWLLGMLWAISPLYERRGGVRLE